MFLCCPCGAPQLVSYYPDLAVSGAAATVRSFAEPVVSNGIRRLVLLSGRGEEGTERGEQAVRDSGAEWTIVRASWFCQNFGEGYQLDQVLGGEAAGREVRFIPVTIKQYTGGLAEQDVPTDVRWLLTYLFTEVLDGRNAQLNDGVQRALGRTPRDFTDYARQAVAAGVWNDQN